MAVDTPAQRLAWARKRHGIYKTPTDAARAFGWTVSTYLGHENADRNPSRKAAQRYAKAYGVRWEWILEGDGLPIALAGQFTTMPLISWVNAGQLVDASTQISVDDAPLLSFADLGQGDFFALRVEGDSMDRLSPPGSVIVVDKADREPIEDRAYVFSVRGETTYKLWHPKYLAPFSTNPKHKPIFIERKRDLEIIGRVRRTFLDL